MTEDKAEGAGPDASTSTGQAEPGQESPALAVIAAFGGIRPMAGKLEVAVSTVQGWKERGVIPANRHGQILEAAKTHGIALDPKLLADSDHAEAATPQATPQKDGDAAPAASAIPASGPSATVPSRAAAAESAPAQRGAFAWVPAFLLGALVMAVGAVLAIVTVDRWHGPGGDSEAQAALHSQVVALQAEVTKLTGELGQLRTAADTKQLEARIETLTSAESDLSTRVKTLEQHAAQPSASPDELADLSKSNQDLSGRLTSLQGKLGEVEKLEQQVAALSKSLDAKHTLAAGEVAKLLALDRLRFALADSEPYGGALTSLKSSLGSDPALSADLGPLEAHAATGLPTVTQLRVQFAPVAKAIAAAGAGEEGGVMSGIWKRLATVVSVRPVGPAEGGSPGAIAARAEVALEDGDLASAVKELEGLSGAAAEAAASWLAQAKARVAAEQALAKLSDALVAQLTAAGG